MEINESIKFADLRKDFFSHAQKSSLYKTIIETNGKIVFGRGSDTPRVLFIGEAPGFSENAAGKPFVGRSGKLLDQWIKELALKENDFAIINVVPIIPLSNENKIRPPTEEEINYFLPFTEKVISAINPEIIVLLGKSASSIFDKNIKLGQLKEWKHMQIFFIYHPSYYLRNGGKGFEDTIQILKEILKQKRKQASLTNF